MTDKEEVLDEESTEGIKSAEGFDDSIIILDDRKFIIEEPTVEITLRILNVIGNLGVRGERVAAQQLARDPSARAAIFGLLAVMHVGDLQRLGSAVLQFEDDREGRKFMQGLHKKGALKVAPLIKAFFLNWSKSEDLQEALANFYQGVATLGATLRSINLVIEEKQA